MIDYIKAYTNDKHLANWLRNTICTVAEVDTKSGEISVNTYTGKCNQFEIKVFNSGRVQFKGSLHKYHSGGFNHTDFHFDEVCQTIFSFSELIGIRPDKAFLENVEFGINIPLPYCPSILLQNIISLTCGKVFVPQQGRGSKCSLGEYRHKIYDKGTQNNLGRHLLRYELHIDKMRKIAPVKTLHDLTKPENWQLFQSMLLSHFSQIIFTDSYNEKQFSKHQSTYFNSNKDKINNSRFWRGLKPVDRFRHLQRVRVIQQKGQYRFGTTVSGLINAKIDELKTGNVFPVQLLSENITLLTHYPILSFAG